MTTILSTAALSTAVERIVLIVLGRRTAATGGLGGLGAVNTHSPDRHSVLPATPAETNRDNQWDERTGRHES
jgi:hypothetical protein